MTQSLSLSQTEMALERVNLNTILALVREPQKNAIHTSGQVSDFGLFYATQFPGGGELW